MTRMHLWVSTGIIVVFVFVAFALSVPHTRDIAVKGVSQEATTTPVVVLHDAYKKGVHTLTVSLTVPNACTPVSASATLAGDASSTERILLALTTQESSGICLQVPMSVPFQTTLTAPSGIPIEASVNGSPASTTSS